MDPTSNQSPIAERGGVAQPANGGSGKNYDGYYLENGVASKEVKATTGETFTLKIHFPKNCSEEEIKRRLASRDQSADQKIADMGVAMNLGVKRNKKLIDKLSFQVDSKNQTISRIKHYSNGKIKETDDLLKHYKIKVGDSEKTTESEKLKRRQTKEKSVEEFANSYFGKSIQPSPSAKEKTPSRSRLPTTATTTTTTTTRSTQPQDVEEVELSPIKRQREIKSNIRSVEKGKSKEKSSSVQEIEKELATALKESETDRNSKKLISYQKKIENTLLKFSKKIKNKADIKYEQIKSMCEKLRDIFRMSEKINIPIDSQGEEVVEGQDDLKEYYNERAKIIAEMEQEVAEVERKLENVELEPGSTSPASRGRSRKEERSTARGSLKEEQKGSSLESEEEMLSQLNNLKQQLPPSNRASIGDDFSVQKELDIEESPSEEKVADELQQTLEFTEDYELLDSEGQREIAEELWSILAKFNEGGIYNRALVNSAIDEKYHQLFDIFEEISRNNSISIPSDARVLSELELEGSLPEEEFREELIARDRQVSENMLNGARESAEGNALKKKMVDDKNLKEAIKEELNSALSELNYYNELSEGSKRDYLKNVANSLKLFEEYSKARDALNDPSIREKYTQLLNIYSELSKEPKARSDGDFRAERASKKEGEAQSSVKKNESAPRGPSGNLMGELKGVLKKRNKPGDFASLEAGINKRDDRKKPYPNLSDWANREIIRLSSQKINYNQLKRKLSDLSKKLKQVKGPQSQNINKKMNEEIAKLKEEIKELLPSSDEKFVEEFVKDNKTSKVDVWIKEIDGEIKIIKEGTKQEPPSDDTGDVFWEATDIRR